MSDELRDPARCAPGVEAREARLDPVPDEQSAGDAGVLGGDERDRPEHLERPLRDIRQVADGRGDDEEPAAGRSTTVRSTLGHPRPEPGRRRGYR